MEVTLFPDADAAYIRIQPGKCHHTNEVNDATFVDVDADGKPLNIQFLYVSDGVDQHHIPSLTDRENQQVFTLLQESGITVVPPARFVDDSRP